MMSIPPKVRSPFVWSLTKRQVCSLTLIITLLCSSCLIAGYSYAASIGAQKYPTSYMEGGPTGAYDYMIYTFQNDTNTYYAAKNSFGDNIDSWTSTDLATVIQNSLDAGHGRVFVNLIGNHEISKQIVMDRGTQYIYGVADSSTPERGTWLTLADNVNASMFLINGTTNHDYYGIARFYINGNKGTQSSGHGIESIGSPLHVELDHIQSINAKQVGFYLVGGQILEMQSCFAAECGSTGIYLQNWNYKSVIKQSWAFSNPTNIHCNNLQDVEFQGLLSYNSTVYSGITLENCYNLKFYGLDLNNNWEEGLKFYGSRYVSIFGGVAKNNGQKNTNVYSSISFINSSSYNSTYNVIDGMVIYSTTAKVAKYHIYDANTNQDYNIFSDIRAYGAGTANIYLQSTNNKIGAGCWNGTSYLPPSTS